MKIAHIKIAQSPIWIGSYRGSHKEGFPLPARSAGGNARQRRKQVRAWRREGIEVIKTLKRMT